MNFMNWEALAIFVAAVVSAAASLFAAWQASSLRRQLGEEVQKERLVAYKGFWAATKEAAGLRLEGDWAGGPLSNDDRCKLFHGLTEWYYGTSGGIYLPDKTRRLYLEVKKNLLRPESEIEPKAALEELIREYPHARNTEEQRSVLAIRQISLLRWVMRFDLDIRTDPYTAKLMPTEQQLLKNCQIKLNKRPFKGNWKPTKPSVTS